MIQPTKELRTTHFFFQQKRWWKVVVFLSFFAFFVPTTTLQAQPRAVKKEIQNARDNVKKNKNLEQAETAMKKLIADSAYHNNLKIWNIMAEAVKKQYEQGNEKLYLKQQYDTAKLFNLAKRMFTVYEGLDSIDALPNNDGETKPQHRKRNADMLLKYRPNLFNGGMYFIHKQKFADAYNLFDMYLDCTRQPLFSHLKIDEKDQRLPEAAYWAVYCGYKMKDAKATLHHAYTALKDTAHFCLMLQYLAETYKIENDSARYVETLQEGFNKYPRFAYFFERLAAHHAENKQWQKLVELSDNALATDSTNTAAQLTKSTALLNLGQYNACASLCNSILVKNDSLPEALLNAGLAHFRQAVETDRSTQRMTAKRKQKITKQYQSALPYLTKYRALRPNDDELWGLPLYMIYLNLNMGNEFDEIDKILREKQHRQKS